ncbi:antibiotic biosynthesis monooxygenase family protein [Trinickia dinghuensis]|uniref:Antibiotic biosynthesis monooxygenase n=1 Tax=Trinickia dinghuensis TaxID=2291023 RepID=A0A3D8K574_9BURK|nr:antibiotic biosynthesis monooxygenase family protein [Trinickia dinghuensis]RDV00598.1 antibiotic biosynthesis monooxygenase [Trinickia dinghuensis]
MVLEMAHIEVLPGTNEAFESKVKEALPLFARAKGCGGAQLHRIVEHEARYVLIVRWETVEDHMVHFRESDDFQVWRGLVGSFFAKPPEVVHTEVRVE